MAILSYVQRLFNSAQVRYNPSNFHEKAYLHLCSVL